MAFIALSMDDILITSLQQGITPAIVVAIYLIVAKLIDIKRENKQITLSSNLINSVNKISKFLDDITSNIINKEKEKCKFAIEDSMFSSAHRITNFISSTIINNHVYANKEIILANIHSTIISEFYNVKSTLSLYKYNGIHPSNYMDIKWVDDVEKCAIDTIYNDELTKEDKILTFSKRITIIFQSYITDIITNINK